MSRRVKHGLRAAAAEHGAVATATATVLATIALAAAAMTSAGSTAVGVGLREYRITPYRSTVPPGEVRFNIRNYGEDGHNLVVRGPGGFRARAPEIDSGASFTLTAELTRAGIYRLLCTTADHHRRGMRSRIRVVRR